MKPDEPDLPRMSVLGIPINVTTLQAATAHICDLTERPGPHMIFSRDVASLMAAVDCPRLRALHDHAALVLPDGMPLVWHGRLMGLGKAIGRVAGPDLVEAVCATPASAGKRHFFYGGRPGIAQSMATRLAARYPGLIIAGTLSPPMRDIGADFTPDRAALAEIETIRAAQPDFIWVGLSSPKQEFWMYEARKSLGHGVLLGVGAAFDFHSGRLRRAPPWMRDNGFEWLHRLLGEPRRLWRRYLIQAPRFVLSLGRQALFGGKRP